MFLGILQLAARNLVMHGRKHLLLGGAIAMVTASLVVVFALGRSLVTDLYDVATSVHSGQLNVEGTFKPGPQLAEQLLLEPGPVEALIQREIPGARIAPRLYAWGGVSSEKGALMRGTQIFGLDATREPGLANSLKIVAGDFQDLARPGHVLLFSKQARKLEVGPGDVITLAAQTSRSGTYNTVDVTVAAVAEGESANLGMQVLVHLDSVTALLGHPEEAVSRLQIHVPDDAPELPVLQDRLAKALKAEGHAFVTGEYWPFMFAQDRHESEPWMGQRVQVITWEDVMAESRGRINGFMLLLGLLRVLLVVLVTFGLANGVAMMVHERTREIGTLRAMGLGHGLAIWMFVAELLLLQLLAGGVGILLGAAGCGLLNGLNIPVPLAFQVFMGAGDHLSFDLDLVQSLSTLGLMVTVMSLAVVVTVARSSALKPILAIQQRS